MKKNVMAVFFAVSCLALSVVPGRVEAATVMCNGVSVQQIGVSNSARYVNLKNETGASCGTFANNTVRNFYLATTDADGEYAAMLTALSLQKKMIVYITGDAAANQLVTIAAVKN